MKKLFFVPVAAIMLATNVVKADIMAVIDSGVDVKHVDLMSKVWTNPNETRNRQDTDGNGYIDDINGWNFAESNNLVIDYKYLGTFSDDPYTFFEIQARQFQRTATPEDLEWLQERRGDQTFAQEMQKFGNFIHGTHVAGIAMKHAEKSKLLSVKIIPTEVSPFIADLKAKAMQAKGNKSFAMGILKAALGALAKQQMGMLTNVAVYISNHGAKIANGSFGTGYEQAEMIAGMLFPIVFFRQPEADELKEAALHFMNALLENGKTMVQSAPNTLFVFAAGNSGTDNDKLPTSPANIQAMNVISVAATFDFDSLASFSNFGSKTVDVAAPGVIIDSAIPGDEYLKVSGTSQAAPYVASVALKVKEINPNLTPSEIKKIVLGTVDLKPFLKGKVKSGGVVNLDRATHAAQMTKSVSIDEAISFSKASVADQRSHMKAMKKAGEGVVLPMPAMFNL
jgi:subtilisin family serine protease